MKNHKPTRRLHPLWLGPWLLRAFLFLLLPLGQALFSGVPVSRTLTAAAIAAGIFLFLLWFSSRAWREGDRLTVEKGIFLRQKSFFSLSRCRAVQVKTPLSFHLFQGCLVELPGRGRRFSFPLPRRMALTLFPSYSQKPLFTSSLPASLCCAFSQSGPLGGILLLAMWLRRWENLPGVPTQVSSTLENLDSLSAFFQTADLVGQFLLWGWLFSFFHRFGCLWPCRLYRVQGGFLLQQGFWPPSRTFFSARRVVSVFRAWRPPWPARYGCLVVNLWGCSQRQAFYLPLSRRLPFSLSKTGTEHSHRFYVSYLWLPTLWLGVSVLLPFVALRIAPTLFLLSFFPLPPAARFWLARWYCARFGFFHSGRRCALLTCRGSWLYTGRFMAPLSMMTVRQFPWQQKKKTGRLVVQAGGQTWRLLSVFPLPDFACMVYPNRAGPASPSNFAG